MKKLVKESLNKSKFLKTLQENEEEIKDFIRNYYNCFIDEDETFDDIQFQYSSNDTELLTEVGEEFFGDVETFDNLSEEEYAAFFKLDDEVINEPEMEVVKRYLDEIY